MSAEHGSGIAAAGLAALEALRTENRAAAARLQACHDLLALCEEQQFARDVEAGYYEPDGPERPRDHAVLDPFDVACAELVATYGVHHHRASAMLTLARDLVTSFPGIVEAMGSGLLDERTAVMLVRQMRTVDSSVLDAVHRLVVDWLLDSIDSGERPGRNAILAKTDSIIADFDPEGVLARRAAAACERRVSVRRGVDGMAELRAHLTSTEASAIHEALGHTAGERFDREKRARIETVRNGTGPAYDPHPRTRQQHRADALVDAILGTGDQGDGDGDGAGGRHAGSGPAGLAPGPQIRPIITILAPRGPGEEPEVYLPRGGPASIDALIALLARSVGAHISLPDPEAGSADSVGGARRYRISAELARRIRLRDGTCRHPGCSVSAEDCDVDHVVPFDHSEPGRGGQTVEANLMCLCRRHHRFKTFHTWYYRLLRNGTLTVVTESGHTITTLPDGPLAKWRDRTCNGPEAPPGPGSPDRPWLRSRPLSTHWYRRACRIAAQRRENAAAARDDRLVGDDHDPPPF
ncbi:HNH endonuclease [Dietzia cercidiphylli]|uniref:HNH endonuclease n=1 Tax=Dietzia cercidiphylli TaxID=498199 RepID=UPI00223B3D4E|nr:HNH endonuclease signature motif containing protein [Dietzia cercidiphylli]MCT1515177.1 HNH endonuclease [Dietzia cercidiphylli]